MINTDRLRDLAAYYLRMAAVPSQPESVGRYFAEMADYLSSIAAAVEESQTGAGPRAAPDSNPPPR